MPVTLSIDAPWEGNLHVHRSPLAELVCCLHAVREPGHHPRSRAWTERFLEIEDGEIAAAARAWDPLWGAFKARYFLPLTVDGAGDVDDEIDRLSRLPVADFAAMSAQALAGQNAFLVTRDQELDGPLGDSLVRRMQLVSPAHLRLAERLLADPAALQRELVDFLTRVAEHAFSEEWAQVTPLVSQGLERKQRLVQSDPWRAFEDLPLAAVDRDRREIVFDKLYPALLRLSRAPVLLVPSVHVSPHTPLKHYPGYPMVIHFPVSPDAADDRRSTAIAVARVAALDHPARLVICRDLLREPSSTTDLAHRMRMTVPQVSRHLRRLRECGLIIGHREGAVVRYQLDLVAFRRIGLDLVDVLRR